VEEKLQLAFKGQIALEACQLAKILTLVLDAQVGPS
jgi:hypothetical protein